MATTNINAQSNYHSAREAQLGNSFSTIIGSGPWSPGAGEDVGLFTNRIAGLEAYTSTDQYRANRRMGLYFNVSGIPTNAIIDSATVNLYVSSKFTQLGTTDLVMYSWPTTFAVYPAPSAGTYCDQVPFADIGLATTTAFDVGSATIADMQGSLAGGSFVQDFIFTTEWDYTGTFDGTWSSSKQTRVSSSISVNTTLDITYHVGTSSSASVTVKITPETAPRKAAKATAAAEVKIGAFAIAGAFETQTIFKTYIYKVYDKDGNFIGVWNDAGEPSYTQRINEAGSEIRVRLPRSAERLIPSSEILQDETGETMVTESGEELLINTEALVTVGTGTDVDVGYKIELYVYYGSNEALLTEDGEPIVTEDGELIFVGVGAPNGSLIFKGWVIQYDAVYGAQESIDVVLYSEGWELSKRVLLDGADTEIVYNSQDPSVILKDILDKYNGSITYTTDSIDITGTSVSQTFNLDTVKESIDKVLQLCPSDYYWYVDLGTSVLHLKEKSATADHTLVLGRDIQSISISRSIEELTNTVYFVGGDSGGGKIFKKYSDAASITEWGVFDKPITDLSITTAGGAQIKSEDFTIERLKDPRYVSEVTVNSGTFDTELFKVGQSIAFSNFNNFVDSLILQVVAIIYGPEVVTLRLDYELPQQRQRIEDVKRNQATSDKVDIGSAPS